MARPIKVPDDLYETLEKVADRQGVSMLDAMRQHLEGYDEQLRQASAERKRLASRLAAAERSAGQSRHQAAVSSQTTADLRQELAASEQQLVELGKERDRLRKLNREWASHADGVNAQLEKLRTEHQREKRRQATWLWIYSLIVLAIVVWMAVQMKRQAPQRKELSKEAGSASRPEQAPLGR